jgi:hypothetical protein
MPLGGKIIIKRIISHFVLKKMYYFKWGRMLCSSFAQMVGNVWLNIRSKMQWTNITKLIVHNKLRGGAHEKIVNK